MSSLQEQNKELSRRFRAECDNGNWPVVEELVSPTFVFHAPGVVALDRTSMVQMLRVFYGAFPDLHHTFEDFIAEGDKVAVRFTLSGTHEGDFQGLPPTGKTVSFSGSVVDRFEDGKLVEHWSLTDDLGLRQQLGVIPGA